jgi:hypothetical protein
MLRSIAALSAAPLAAAQPAPCCAYGGKGSVYMYGRGAIDIGGGRGSQALDMVFGVTGSAAASPALVVLVNATAAEDSVAGWRISLNANGTQTLTAWNKATQQCVSGLAPPTQPFAPGFDLCPGMPRGSLFPDYAMSYTLGGAALVHAYGQPSGAIAAFLDGPSCAVVSILAPGSPIADGGAFSFAAINGGSASPPPEMLELPSYC